VRSCQHHTGSVEEYEYCASVPVQEQGQVQERLREQEEQGVPCEVRDAEVSEQEQEQETAHGIVSGESGPDSAAREVRAVR
jgi:GMP synthase-like glutamine amidotransferase